MLRQLTLLCSRIRKDSGLKLSILATALIETGSRMDDLIFEEFKGTGNLELVLDRRLAERRIWPAIDISKSGTRCEEKLLESGMLHSVGQLRRELAHLQPADAMQQLTGNLVKHRTNRELLVRLMQMDRDGR